MTVHGWWRWPAAVMLAWVCATETVAAQEAIPPPMVAAVAGAFRHPFEGKGTGTLLGLRLALPLLRYLGVEPALHFVHYRGVGESEDGSPEEPTVPLLLGDLQIQGLYPMEKATPYVGVGVGTALDLRENRSPDQDFVSLTYTAAGGVRVELPGAFVALVEARLRGMDRMARDATTLVVGIGATF